MFEIIGAITAAETIAEGAGIRVRPRYPKAFFAQVAVPGELAERLHKMAA